jgi:hypothetical protein
MALLACGCFSALSQGALAQSVEVRHFPFEMAKAIVDTENRRAGDPRQPQLGWRSVRSDWVAALCDRFETVRVGQLRTREDGLC